MFWGCPGGGRSRTTRRRPRTPTGTSRGPTPSLPSLGPLGTGGRGRGRRGRGGWGRGVGARGVRVQGVGARSGPPTTSRPTRGPPRRRRPARRVDCRRRRRAGRPLSPGPGTTRSVVWSEGRRGRGRGVWYMELVGKLVAEQRHLHPAHSPHLRTALPCRPRGGKFPEGGCEDVGVSPRSHPQSRRTSGYGNRRGLLEWVGGGSVALGDFSSLAGEGFPRLETTTQDLLLVPRPPDRRGGLSGRSMFCPERCHLPEVQLPSCLDRTTGPRSWNFRKSRTERIRPEDALCGPPVRSHGRRDR